MAVRTIILLLLVAASSAAAMLQVRAELPPQNEPPRAASDESRGQSVVVPACRIKLIDQVVLAGERSGTLEWVAAEGTVVKPGEVVIRLRDRLAQAARAITAESAKNDVEVRFAEKASELAQLAYARTVKVNHQSDGSFSDFAIRELRLAAEKSILQLEQAEHHLAVEKLKLREAEETLASYRVNSPQAGLVRKVHKQRGEAVREGEPIVEVVNTSRVQAEGFVTIEESQNLRIGLPVEVRLVGASNAPLNGSPAHRGRISFIDVKAEPVTSKIRVWAEVANPSGRLKDGLIARMSVQASAANGVSDASSLSTTARD